MSPKDIDIGQRVVHALTKGRVRGTVEAITIKEHSTADVLVDGFRIMSYAVRNLEPESTWDAQHKSYDTKEKDNG